MGKKIENLASLLPKAIAQNPHLKAQIEEEKMKQCIQHIFGEVLMKYISDIKLQQQKIIIFTTQSVLKQELLLQKERLLLRINEQISAPFFEEIIVKSG